MDHAARFAIHKDSECLHLLAISYRISLEALLSSYFSPQISSAAFLMYQFNTFKAQG